VNITTRLALPADEEPIGILAHAATQDLRRVYRPRLATPGATGAAARLERYVALVEERLVGVVEWVPGADVWYVRGLAVESRTRRAGVARALLDAVACEARRTGAQRLALSTILETGNVAIFVRLGFVEVARGAAPGFEAADGGAVARVDMERAL